MAEGGLHFCHDKINYTHQACSGHGIILTYFDVFLKGKSSHQNQPLLKTDSKSVSKTG
jgi:hypothetical protein